MMRMVMDGDEEPGVMIVAAVQEQDAEPTLAGAVRPLHV